METVSKRPDGGWGWVVAVATFMMYFMTDGSKYSFGIMFIDLLNTFKQSRSDTSWILSIQVGFSQLPGPLIGALVNRYGCRATAIAGAALSALGLILSFFGNSLLHLYITFGLITGTGFGMFTIPFIVSLARHFDRRLSVATGLGAMGTGVGIIVLNPVTKILLDEYAWRGTILLQAGLFLNGIICACALRPLRQPRSKRNRGFEVTITLDDGKMEELRTMLSTSAVTTEEQQSAREIFSLNTPKIATGEILESNGNVKLLNCVKNLEEKESNLEPNYVDSNIHKQTKISTVSSAENVGTNQETNEKTFEFESNHNGNSPNQNRNVDSEGEHHLQKQTNSNFTLYTDAKHDGFTNPAGNDDGLYAGTEILEKKHEKRWLSIEPLKTPSFWFYFMSSVMLEFSLYVPYTFIPDMMVELGHQKQDAVWVMFSIGVASTVGRVVIGPVADLGCMNRVRICYIVTTLCAVSIAIVPLCSHFATFMGFGVLFGALSGSALSIRGVVIPDLYGVDKVADFLGIMYFFGGIAAFIGLPIAGGIVDVSGSYTVTMLVAATEMAAAGILVFVASITAKK